MEFKKIEIEDIEILKDALKDYRERICDISPGNLVFWRDYYDISYYFGEDGFVIRFGNMDGVLCYWCEAENHALIERIIKKEGGSACFTCLSPREKDIFCEGFDCSDIEHARDWDDYIYNARDIISLKGKRYNGQRNHINKFNRLYSDVCFEEICDSNIEAVKEFCYGYFHSFGREKAKVAEYEEKYLEEQLNALDKYVQCTGVLKVDGMIVGISIGEIVGETLIVHTEKADTDCIGVYPMLVRSFAERYAGGCLYINREEDCGVEGLRTSKLSYHPIEILEKYCLIARLH